MALHKEPRSLSYNTEYCSYHLERLIIIKVAIESMNIWLGIDMFLILIEQEGTEMGFLSWFHEEKNYLSSGFQTKWRASTAPRIIHFKLTAWIIFKVEQPIHEA